LRAKFANDSNFFVPEVGRESGVLKFGLVGGWVYPMLLLTPEIGIEMDQYGPTRTAIV